MTRLHVKKLPKNDQFESFLFLESPVAKRGGNEVEISVTRFEEISYLWQKIKLLGTFLSALLGSNWQNFEPTQAIKICFWAKFHWFTEFGQNNTANHLGTLVEMQNCPDTRNQNHQIDDYKLPTTWNIFKTTSNDDLRNMFYKQHETTLNDVMSIDVK